MLNRFRLNFDNVYSYATKQPQLFQIEDAIVNADEDVAKYNLETIKTYRYIYCESDNKFTTQLGREFCTSAKNYGILGLEAATVGLGISLASDGCLDTTTAALSLVLGGVGGTILGGLAGGIRAIHAQASHELLDTPEEKARVFELQQLAESRVSFFNCHKNVGMQQHDQGDDKKRMFTC